jgi:hypothetical protein
LFSRKQGTDGVEQPKIIAPETAFKAQMSFDIGAFYHVGTIYSFIKKNAIKEDYKYFCNHSAPPPPQAKTVDLQEHS